MNEPTMRETVAIGMFAADHKDSSIARSSFQRLDPEVRNRWFNRADALLAVLFKNGRG